MFFIMWLYNFSPSPNPISSWQNHVPLPPNPKIKFFSPSPADFLLKFLIPTFNPTYFGSVGEPSQESPGVPRSHWISQQNIKGLGRLFLARLIFFQIFFSLQHRHTMKIDYYVYSLIEYIRSSQWKQNNYKMMGAWKYMFLWNRHIKIW